MVHRDDLVAAMLLAAADPGAAGRTYIVTDGAPYSTREIYEAIEQQDPVRASALMYDHVIAKLQEL